MISAGQDTVTPKKRQQDLLCGRDWANQAPDAAGKTWAEENTVNTQCENKVGTVYDKYTQGLNADQLKYFHAVYAKVGGTQPYFNCENNPGLRAPLGPDIIKPFAVCTADHVMNADRKFVHNGQELSYEPMMALIKNEALGLVTIAPEKIEIPESLRKYIKSLRDQKLDKFADLAKRLFREGLAKVEPSGERVLAAQPIADQVEADVKKRVLPHIAAAKDAKKKKAIEDDLDYVFVLKTGPKDKDTAKAYKLTIQQAPADLMKAFEKYPPEVRRELMRLYGEALEKAPTADQKSVADALVTAVDAKLGEEKDAKKMADKLGTLTVDNVKTSDDGKKAESVSLKEVKVIGPSQTLIDGFEAQDNLVKKALLYGIWSMIRKELGAKPGETIDPELKKKIETSVLQHKDKTLSELAAMYVASVDGKNGTVHFNSVPKDALGIPQDLEKRGITLGSDQMGAVGIIVTIRKIYVQALQAASGEKSLKDYKGDALKAEVAKRVDRVARKQLDADMLKDLPEKDAQAITHNFTGLTFSKFDEKTGDILLTYMPGFAGVGGPGDGQLRATLAEGAEFVFGVESSLGIGGVIGVNRPENDKTSDVVAAAFVRAYAGVSIDKKYTIDAALAALGVYSPSIYTVGLPNGDRSVAVNDDDGAYGFVRLNEATVGFKGKWGLKDDGTPDDITYQLGRIAAGIQSGHIGDGTDLALPDDLDPFNSYQPFSSPGGSRLFGVTVPFTLGIASERLKITPRFVLGTASAGLNNKETYFGGGRVGGDLKVDLDAGKLAGFEETDWRILLAGGAQHSWGDKDDVPNKLAGTAFAIGGSTMVQPTDYLQLALGGGYGRMDADLDGLTQRAVIGGNVMFPIKMADGKWHLIPGAGVSWSTTWKDQQVAGTSRNPGEAPAPNPGCEPGYDCPGTAVDVGEGAGDRVAALGSEYDFFMIGRNVVAINALLGLTFEDAPWLNPFAGFSLFNATTHETGSSDLAGMVRAGVKVEY
ncbi:MAG: hypothetical protein ABH871_01985 [Pseudomonadota bacterium]